MMERRPLVAVGRKATNWICDIQVHLNKLECHGKVNLFQ